MVDFNISLEKALKKEDMKPRIVVSGQLEKKLKKRSFKRQIRDKGLILIRHIPHGFYEEQIKDYFEQFGTVTRVRVVRSKRTGSPKGFAYVEFQYPEVAKVAAETMNNYLMFQKLIKATYIPPEQQHFNYFKTSIRKVKTKSGKYKWLSSKTASIQRKMAQYNNWSEKNYNKRANRQLSKIKKLCTKFSHLGIDINQCVVPPNNLIDSEKNTKLLKTNEDNTVLEDIELVSKKPTSLLSQASHKNLGEKKLKKNIYLDDLLGDTVQEDSNDEGYTMSNGTITLEKSYDKSTGNTIVQKCSVKESVPLYNKLLSTSNVEYIDKLLKRKKLGDTKESQASQSSHKNKDEKIKLRKDMSLTDTLGDTIQEDTDDEDYSAAKISVSLETPSEKFYEKNKKATIVKYSPIKSVHSVLLSNKLSNASKVKCIGKLHKCTKHNGVKKVVKNKQTKREITKLCKENIIEFAQHAVTPIKKLDDKVKSKKGIKVKIIKKN